ncbi:Uncharacterized protein GBIM_14305 [Gryllus bimaculatus]|nr:Uncharacterized protein GBIM_14305 [Gryllus bimaculatus]
MAHSRDANELRHLWVEWRHASGEKCRGLFERYVALSNESSILNNYTDTSEVWLEPYEAKDFRDQVRELWEQLRPLYEQLHAYVRRKLQEQYGEAEVSRDGPIPAHLVEFRKCEKSKLMFNRPFLNEKQYRYSKKF